MSRPNTPASPTQLAGLAETQPIPLKNPERCPGAYVMHFYCKYENPKHPWQPGGNYMEEPCHVETRAQAIAQMRASGWKYHRDGTATCNICAAALRSHIQESNRS